jgi:hypothetical protein
MISEPTRTTRLFARGLVLLSSPPIAWRKPRVPVQIRVREFLTLGHFMAYGEPATFELSVSNVIEEPREIHGSAK